MIDGKYPLFETSDELDEATAHLSNEAKIELWNSCIPKLSSLSDKKLDMGSPGILVGSTIGDKHPYKDLYEGNPAFGDAWKREYRPDGKDYSINNSALGGPCKTQQQSSMYTGERLGAEPSQTVRSIRIVETTERMLEISSETSHLISRMEDSISQLNMFLERLSGSDLVERPKENPEVPGPGEPKSFHEGLKNYSWSRNQQNNRLRGLINHFEQINAQLNSIL